MSRTDLARVTLPGGVLRDGERRQDALLRPLTGHEEELLAALPVGVPVAERVTAVLVRCLERLGPDTPAADDVRGLTVGDREALLLHLRRITTGERIDCVLRCAQQRCGELVDVELTVSQLLVDPYEQVAAWHEEAVVVGGERVRVRLRPPTGGDQEAVAGLALDDPAAAAQRLLARCAELPGAGGDLLDTLGEEGLAEASARMAELDPQAELRLQTDCPACASPLPALFDTASFLFAEAATAADRLSEEIHALAWYYHWSEADILDLTARRRRRYLDLIAASTGPTSGRGVA